MSFQLGISRSEQSGEILDGLLVRSQIRDSHFVEGEIDTLDRFKEGIESATVGALANDIFFIALDVGGLLNSVDFGEDSVDICDEAISKMFSPEKKKEEEERKKQLDVLLLLMTRRFLVLPAMGLTASSSDLPVLSRRLSEA